MNFNSFGFGFGGGNPIGALAKMSGAQEPALRLLLSILAGYPIAALYRIGIEKAPKALQHMFFALIGFGLCTFNYGFDVYHSLIAIWITYMLVRVFYRSPTKLMVTNFVFHMSYLLIGYYYTESDDYDIKWTMPHCVLVLRLIGFGFDIADGQKQSHELSREQRNTALVTIPSILELSAYAYFPSAFLVGPQFPFKRYFSYINGEFRQYKGSVAAGLKRGAVGVIYLAARQIGAAYLPDEYFVSAGFAEAPFLTRMLHMGIWGKICLYKYISCWLLTEGALMCAGFTYNGQLANGESDWFGCSNVKLILFETGRKMNDYVESFNVNTNHWLAQYVYKRLKFLNNRTLSYAGALIFLALWHGFHSGYYMAFFFEYAIITFEKQFAAIYTEAIQKKFGNFFENSTIGVTLTFLVCKAYNILFMGWCLLPFVLLKFDRYIIGMDNVCYIGFFIFPIWLPIYGIYHACLRKYFTAQIDATGSVSANIAQSGLIDTPGAIPRTTDRTPTRTRSRRSNIVTRSGRSRSRNLRD